MSDLCDDVFVNEAKEYVNFMKNSMLEQTRENRLSVTDSILEVWKIKDVITKVKKIINRKIPRL